MNRFGLVGVSYGGFVSYRIAELYPERVERVVLVCAGVCLEDTDLTTGLFVVSNVADAAELLVPRRPEKLRELVKLTFVKPPCVMPTCFIRDYIQVGVFFYSKKEQQFHLIHVVACDWFDGCFVVFASGGVGFGNWVWLA